MFQIHWYAFHFKITFFLVFFFYNFTDLAQFSPSLTPLQTEVIWQSSRWSQLGRGATGHYQHREEIIDHWLDMSALQTLDTNTSLGHSETTPYDQLFPLNSDVSLFSTVYEIAFAALWLLFK